MTDPSKSPKDRPEIVKVHIDRELYEVTGEDITGAALRTLPTPPIGVERDLYEIRPGQDDFLVEDSAVVRLRPGLRFFTAPGRINPGQA